MDTKTPDTLEERCKMCKLILDKVKSKNSLEIFLNILNGEAKVGNKNRHPTILKITDILNTTEDESEIMEKINKEFPQYS